VKTARLTHLTEAPDYMDHVPVWYAKRNERKRNVMQYSRRNSKKENSFINLNRYMFFRAYREHSGRTYHQMSKCVAFLTLALTLLIEAL